MNAGSTARVLTVLLLTGLTGCGVIGDIMGNKAEVCAETQRAFTDFGAGLKALPPGDNAAWAKAATDFAGRLDGLAKKADDADLGEAITGLARDWRDAAPSVTADGDVAAFTANLKAQPGRLGTACA